MAEQRAQRRLAAILAADVVGFSRLMEADETGTIAALKARRRDVFDPLVAKHQGRIFKTTGDGVLVEFGSAVNAVQCAVDLQQGMAAANEGQPDNRQIVLRIGVNLGDVMVQGSDLYGDGINIAARLESISEPGGVWISEDAHRQVRNRLNLQFEDLGLQSLKNISEPVRVFRLAGLAVPAAVAPRPVSDRPSVAVLPFDNMSGDPEQQYFSDGITEDIITELSRFRSLLVKARHSSFAFKGKSLTVQEIARELGVAYVLEGSIRRAGDRCRITAQLIEAKSGNHIWAERFDRALADIFAVQDQLIGTIVGTIAGRVEASTAEQLRRKPPSNMLAYDCVLRGKALPVGDAEVEAEARRLYEKAIELDPTFGIAYSYLAYALSLEWFREEDVSSSKLDQALQLAKRGVQCDESSYECHYLLAWIYLNQREFASAEKSCRHAMKLNPNSPACIAQFAEWLSYVGRPQEALELYEQVTQVDPHFNPGWWLRNLGIAHFNARQYEESLYNFTQSLTSQLWVKCYVVACHAYMGNQEKATGVAAEILRQSPNFSARRLMAMEPFRRAEDQAHFLQGMLKAGLPE